MDSDRTEVGYFPVEGMPLLMLPYVRGSNSSARRPQSDGPFEAFRGKGEHGEVLEGFAFYVQKSFLRHIEQFQVYRRPSGPWYT